MLTASDLNSLAYTLDPALVLADALGAEPDPWQRDLVCSTADRVLIVASRQSGKSSAVAALALHEALVKPDSLSLLVSPSQRQSSLLYSAVSRFYTALGRPLWAARETGSELWLSNGSAVISLPGSGSTIRGFSPSLVIVDEAALVPDEVFVAILPMLAVTGGRLVCPTTPMGKRGFFFEQWHGDTAWERIKATAADCPRINPRFLAEQRQILGDRWFMQEYMCEFTETEDQFFSTDSIMNAFDSDEPALFTGGSGHAWT
jgi:Terminase large subunit, T4likevirus-type, N-terminal